MKPSIPSPIQTDRRSPDERPAAPIKSHVVTVSASTSGGQRLMRVSLPAAPWENEG